MAFNRRANRTLDLSPLHVARRAHSAVTVLQALGGSRRTSGPTGCDGISRDRGTFPQSRRNSMLHADCAGASTLGCQDSAIRPIFRVPRRLNDWAACLRFAGCVQELGLQRQERASLSVVRRPPLLVHVVVRVVVVGTGALEHPDRLRPGSRPSGHGGNMHA